MGVTRRLLGGATAMMVTLALSIGSSAADPGGRGRGHAHGHKNKHHREAVYHDYHPVHRSYAHKRFVVPHRIVHASTYAPYYSGQVWYGPHHHAHPVYAFPVYSAYGVAYQPHYYCGPEVFVAAPGYAYDAHYYDRRPRVSVGIQFGF